MVEDEKLKDVVTNWITIDEKIKDLTKELKEARNQHKLATTALVSIMQSKDISGLQLNNNSKLIYSTRKIKSPLSKKILFTALSEYFEEDELTKVIDQILDKRPEKTMEKIERK